MWGFLAKRAAGWFTWLLERNLVPDFLARLGLRALCRAWDRKLGCFGDWQKVMEFKMKFVQSLKTSPIAVETEAANEQHYEVPSAFFQLVLGRWLKYSCCYFGPGVHSLDEAEEAMLALMCERAQIKDGMDVMDLGCGWGSASLWIATKYPNCRVTGVSNSNSQREFIMGEAKRRGLPNLSIITADANVFDTQLRFDRIVTNEMLEHMNNYHSLFQRISTWLKPDGLMFVHVLTNKLYGYRMNTQGDNWMGRNFFTGGIIPSDDLLLYFQEHLKVDQHWALSGEHYAKTLEAWLVKCDRSRKEVMGILRATYGAEAPRKFYEWRMFFLFCAEVFNFNRGQCWMVSQYTFRKAQQ